MKIRNRKSWVVLVAILLLFAACKGESPTAPPVGTTPPGGGTPPTGVSIVLTPSNTTPAVDGTVTITANVTNGGQPVPNGTAVEFTSNGGVLNGGGTSVLKTTTGGIATVTLTSGTTGTIRVTATVNNVTRETAVTFQAAPTTPTPPNTAPTIVSVTPNVGRPTGGETIRITGTNFRPPVRVLFRYAGLATPVEAFVVSATETQITVITPAVNLGAGQQLITDIIVLTSAGTASEARAELTGAFTFRNEQLTPVISTVTPNSGPVTGDTRVTIFGQGFQAPVQVSFGDATLPSWQEARVVTVDFNQIVVMTPDGRSTSPDGSDPVTGPIDVRVVNINSQQDAVLLNAFRYITAVEITAAGPTEGPFTGGTRVTIDGTGFVAPVAVTIGGVAAQVISVSGSKIVAITSGLAVTACADVAGTITVTNIVNGDGAVGPDFTYRVLRPVILSVSASSTPGGPISVRVANAIGIPRLRIGDTNLGITGAIDNGDGTTTFTGTIPVTVSLDTQACPAVPGASRQIPTSFDITFTSVTTTCEDTLQNGVTLVPLPNAPILTLSPAAYTPFSAAITPATVGPPPTPASVTPSGPQTLTLTNTGTGTLTVNSVTPVAGCANFSFSFPAVPAPLQSCDPFPITAVYRGQTTPTTETCTLAISTDAGNRTLTLTGSSQ